MISFLNVKLFIVTEKMATDMLEMILNKQPPQLSERVSKFITYQVKFRNRFRFKRRSFIDIFNFYF